MTEFQIGKFIEEFSNRTLEISKWTHEAHILVALWHNWHYEFDIAFEMVKGEIILYNESVGTPNTDESGYHETLTKFWMMYTKNILSEKHYSSLKEAYSYFNTEVNFNKEIPLQYYTKDVLFSVKARKEWINGNLKEIRLTSKIA